MALLGAMLCSLAGPAEYHRTHEWRSHLSRATPRCVGLAHDGSRQASTYGVRILFSGRCSRCRSAVARAIVRRSRSISGFISTQAYLCVTPNTFSSSVTSHQLHRAFSRILIHGCSSRILMPRAVSASLTHFRRSLLRGSSHRHSLSAQHNTALPSILSALAAPPSIGMIAIVA